MLCAVVWMMGFWRKQLIRIFTKQHYDFLGNLRVTHTSFEKHFHDIVKSSRSAKVVQHQRTRRWHPRCTSCHWTIPPPCQESQLFWDDFNIVLEKGAFWNTSKNRSDLAGESNLRRTNADPHVRMCLRCWTLARQSMQTSTRNTYISSKIPVVRSNDVETRTTKFLHCKARPTSPKVPRKKPRKEVGMPLM